MSIFEHEEVAKRTGTTRRELLMTGLLAGAAVIASGVVDFGAEAQAQTPKKGGVLKIGVGGGSTTDSLDPALVAASMTRIVTRQWGDTLLIMSPEKKLQPRLAESYSSNDAGTVWTFKIRAGVKFHDGSDLTPSDVVATYKRHSDKNSKSSVLPLMQGIADIRAEADTVVISLKSANADLPVILADYHLPIQPKGGVEKPTAAIGTGPYKLVAYEAGTRAVFEKNKDDWDTTRGHYDGLEILVMNDGAARVAALQSGQVHMINQVDPKVASLLKRAPGLTIASVPSAQHHLFQAMTDQAPFNNKDLRLALKYALNRQEMLDKILRGFGSIANDMPINQAYPLYSASWLEQRPFDLEKAAAHYKASGHDGSPIELLTAEVFPGAVDMALLWQASCNKAGIPLVVKRLPDQGYWTETWLKKPFVTDTSVGRFSQDQYYSTFFVSAAPWNASHFSNAEFDQTIAHAREELDPTKRVALYGQAAKILWEEGGAFIPVFADRINAYSQKIAGWYSDPTDELMGSLAPSKTWFA